MDAGAIPVHLNGKNARKQERKNERTRERKNERLRSRPLARGSRPGMAGWAGLPPYWDRTSGGAGGDTGSHV
jgi:hypothetical protein